MRLELYPLDQVEKNTKSDCFQDSFLGIHKLIPEGLIYAQSPLKNTKEG